jgi:hypothetical protein
MSRRKAPAKDKISKGKNMSGTSAQVLSAGGSNLTIRMTDADAKAVMVRTPNVTITLGSRTYDVYEVNPTVVPDVYNVTLRSSLLASVAKGVAVTFGV